MIKSSLHVIGLRGCGWALFLAVAWGSVQASNLGEIRFDRLSLEEGLSQSTVLAIAQDRDGFLWFATEDGLNRFDSYEFLVYRHEPGQPGSLAHNFVNTVLVANDGALWVGTRAGLQRFDTSRMRFEPRLDAPGLDDVTALATADDGALWIGTQAGAVLVRHRDGRVTTELAAGSGGAVTHLEVGGDGQMWVATSTGLLALTPEGAQVAEGAQDLSLGTRVYQTLRIGERLLVASASGLSELDLGSVNDGEVGLSGRFLIEGEAIQSVMQARDGTLYAAGYNGLHQRRGGEWRHYRSDINDPHSIGGDVITSMHEDASGVLWFGTSGFGLSRYSPATSHFRHIAVSADPGAGLNNALVWAIERDRDGGLWIGTKGGGVNVLDPATGRFRYLLPDASAQSVSSDWVLAIHEHRDRTIWLGTRGGGVNRLDRETGEVTVFRHRPGDPESLSNDRVYAIAEGPDGTLWFGTNDGLSWYRPDQDRFGVLDSGDPETGLRDPSIRSLSFDDAGRLWIGTRRGGLHRLDPETGTVEPLLAELAGHLILSICPDDEGTLWLATDHGLVSYRLETGTHQTYGRGDGLPNDLIYGILPGREGELWLSTNRGLSRLQIDAGQFRNFDTGNGLISNEFNQGAYLAEPDGTLLFGTVKGLIVFDPEDVGVDPSAPSALITAVRIANRPLAEFREPGQDGVAVHRLTQIELEPNQRIVTLDFSALYFAAPERARYAYRLLGASDDWVETDAARRSATFTGLSPGHYRFQLRAGNADGVWQTEPTELAIIVLPPFWRTGWAYALYGLSLLTMFGLAIQSRQRKLNRRRVAQKLVAESEERLRLALWGSGDELWDWDLESGVVHRMNEHESLERPDQEAFSGIEHLGSHMHPEDLPTFREALSRHMEGRSRNYEATYRCRNRRGGWTWVMDRGQVVALDREGNPARLTGTTKIIDDLKRTEEQLRVLNEELEQRVHERTSALRAAYEDLGSAQERLVESEKMASLGNLVAGVAHELNTPIGIGLTAASHLKNRVDRLLDTIDPVRLEPDVREYFRHSAESAALIMTSLERAAKMVKSFKQVAVDQAVEEMREFGLKQYLEQIMTSLRPRLRKSPHTVIVECDEDLQLRSYPGAFYQIVSNLVLNSLTHAFPPDVEGTLEIRARAEGDRLLLIYRDDGQGMDEDIRLKVFEPFFTTRRGQGGTGLGMHIVYNIVTQILNGTIECRSAPGEGVEFRFELPGLVAEEEAGETRSG